MDKGVSFSHMLFFRNVAHSFFENMQENDSYSHPIPKILLYNNINEPIGHF